MKSIFATALFASLITSAVAQAETVYTKLDDTVVRDKPVAMGSAVVSHLKVGSMVETVKQVGGFTAISYISDGKVKTGFVDTSQLNGEAKSDMSVADKAQTAMGSEDVASMVNGLTSTDPNKMANDKVQGLKNENMPAGADDPQALLTNQMDGWGVPAKDLAAFAGSGKLVARRPKAKGSAQ